MRNRRIASLRVGLAWTGLTGILWALDARSRSRDFGKLHRVLVDLLLNAMSIGDPVTERHSRRVADLSDALFHTYRIGRRRHATLRVAALMHDLGKIDDRFFHILHSFEPLSPADRKKIQAHPQEGAGILEPLEDLHPGLSSVVEAHHECWNGEGYPNGLRQHEIPLGARIISVADVFDALTQPRSYRDPLPPEVAFREIQKGAGTRFDPEVLERVQRREVWERWVEIAGKGRAEEALRERERNAASGSAPMPVDDRSRTEAAPGPGSKARALDAEGWK